jgi:hypothetical protein
LRTLRVPQNAARLLRNGKPVHPAYLRAAWRAMRHTPPMPIFDTPEVVSVRTMHEAVDAVEVRVDDVFQRVAVDGLLVDDDS